MYSEDANAMKKVIKKNHTIYYQFYYANKQKCNFFSKIRARLETFVFCTLKYSQLH